MTTTVQSLAQNPHAKEAEAHTIDITNSDITTSISSSISDFLNDTAVGHSQATVATYKVALHRFTSYLSLFQVDDLTKITTFDLKTDWAVDFLRWVAVGQPLPQTVANQNTTHNITSTLADNKSVKIPRSTLATYGTALTRFYTWCGTERRLELPADEYARLTRRLQDLRGKVQRTILNKVPADEIIEKLLVQVRTSTNPTESKPGFVATTAKEVTSAEQEPERASNTAGGLARYDQQRHILLRLRNIALLETLKSSGARVSEICNLKVGDLDNTNQRARVVGKGGKERWIYFSPQAWQTIQEYVTARTQQLRLARTSGENSELTQGGDTTASSKTRRARSSIGREVESQPLFARHDRGAGSTKLKPTSPRTIENMLWQLVEEAGLETYITPHKFRHWFATRMLAATGDLATTQDLLGHASPTTTRIYAQVSEQNKQAAHRRVFTSEAARDNTSG